LVQIYKGEHFLKEGIFCINYKSKIKRKKLLKAKPRFDLPLPFGPPLFNSKYFNTNLNNWYGVYHGNGIWHMGMRYGVWVGMGIDHMAYWEKNKALII